MIGLIFTLLALAPPLAAGHTSSRPCDQHLAPSGLGIGALVGGYDGRMSLGLAPYAGTLHRNLVLVLDRTRRVRSIHWLGEASYVIDGRSVRLSVANETSGFYKELMESGRIWNGRPIEVRNSVANLPKSVLAPSFRGIPFDSRNMRLVAELNELKSVRHDIGNALQAAVAFAELMQRADSEAERAEIVARLENGFRRKILLANWFVKHLLETGRLDPVAVGHVHDVLALLLAGQWSTVGATMDRQRLDHEMQVVGREANLSAEDMPVAIFEVFAE